MKVQDEYPPIDFTGYYNVARNRVSDPDPKAVYFTLRDDLSQPNYHELNSFGDAITNFGKRFPCSYTVEFDDRTALVGMERPGDINTVVVNELQLLLMKYFQYWRIVLENESNERVVVYPKKIKWSSSSSLEESLAVVRREYTDYLDVKEGTTKRQLEVVRNRLSNFDVELPAIICVFNRTYLGDSCFGVWIVDEPFPRAWQKNHIQGFEGIVGATDYFLYVDGSLEYRNDINTGKVVRTEKIVGHIKCMAISKKHFTGQLEFLDPQTSQSRVLSFSADVVLNDENLPTKQKK